MQQEFWHFDPPHAVYAAAQLQATLNTAQPQGGFFQLSVAAQAVAGRILQLELSPDHPPQMEQIAEAYVRRADLVATYLQTPARLFRPQIYWRAVPPTEHAPWGGIEEIASVQTSLLDTLPTIDALTTLHAAEILAPRDFELSEFRKITATTRTPEVLDAQQTPGCVVFRLAETNLSYVELALSSDFQQMHFLSQPGGETLLRYSLFGRFLEKGVILRARRRGVFVPRAGDMAAAAACYRALEASELPLTT